MYKYSFTFKPEWFQFYGLRAWLVMLEIKIRYFFFRRLPEEEQQELLAELAAKRASLAKQAELPAYSDPSLRLGFASELFLAWEYTQEVFHNEICQKALQMVDAHNKKRIARRIPRWFTSSQRRTSRRKQADKNDWMNNWKSTGELEDNGPDPSMGASIVITLMAALSLMVVPFFEILINGQGVINKLAGFLVDIARQHHTGFIEVYAAFGYAILCLLTMAISFFAVLKIAINDREIANGLYSLDYMEWDRLSEIAYMLKELQDGKADLQKPAD